MTAVLYRLRRAWVWIATAAALVLAFLLYVLFRKRSEDNVTPSVRQDVQQEAERARQAESLAVQRQQAQEQAAHDRAEGDWQAVVRDTQQDTENIKDSPAAVDRFLDQVGDTMRDGT